VTTAPTLSAPLAYYWGDDEHALEQAAKGFAGLLEARAGGPLERWRARGDEIDPGLLAERVGTGPLFGGGTIVIVLDSGSLVRSTAGRDATIAALDLVAPGNGLVFLDAAETGAKRTGAADRLRGAVAERGGDVRELRSPTEGRMAAWIEREAIDRGLRLGRGAAGEIASRVGAAVREGDVDRRRMSARAAGELDKLALYRPDGVVEVDDVRALVGDAVPASAWAFLDAVGERKARRAAELLDGLLATTPEPVVLAQLHRRIRDLIIVGDLLATGTPEPALVRALKLNPYRAKLLAAQARTWSPDELDAALAGLLDLDAAVKGAEPATPRQVALAFQLWVRDRVAPTGSARARSAPATSPGR
jgi:DNA polymerase III delta subunit